MRIALAALAAALVVAAPAAATAERAQHPPPRTAPAAGALRSTPWRPHVRSASAYAVRRAGHVSFALRTEGRLWGREPRRGVPCASVLKAMLLVAYLRRPSVRDRPLRRADRRLLAPMVRRSDNATASRVRVIVGDAGLMALARRSGMHRFVPAMPIWGLSRVDAADQTRFMLHVDRLMPPRHRAWGLRQLGSIVPAQRWGIARERPPGWALYFKGGWGSASGAVDHQVALLRRGRRRLAVAIMTTDSPSHAYATRTLRGIAARLLRGLGPSRRPVASAARPAADHPGRRPATPGPTSVWVTPKVEGPSGLAAVPSR